MQLKEQPCSTKDTNNVVSIHDGGKKEMMLGAKQCNLTLIPR